MAVSHVPDDVADDDENEPEDALFRLRIPPDEMPTPPGYTRWFDGALYRQGWEEDTLAPLPTCTDRCYIFRYRSPNGPDDLLMALRVHDAPGHEAQARQALLEIQATDRAEAERLALPPTLVTPHLRIDFTRGEVRVDGEMIALSATERRAFLILARAYAQLVPHETLLDLLWGDNPEDGTYSLRQRIGSLRTQIGRLRLKLEPEDPHRYIHNQPGVGYILEDREGTTADE